MKELKEVDYNPICPHCGKEIEQLCVHPRRGSTLLRKEAPLAGIFQRNQALNAYAAFPAVH